LVQGSIPCRLTKWYLCF